MIKVMIIEDEPAAALILRKMIEKAEGFEVAEVCGNVSQALAAYMKSRPEVCFVDIDLNGESGLICAKTITQLNPDVKVIFATAHNEYMADAFEIYAFDYLVKPFNRERVQRTLERIRRSRREQNNNSSQDQRNSIVEKSEQTGKENSQEALFESNNGRPHSENDLQHKKVASRLILRGRERTLYLDVNDILMAEHKDDATLITTGDGTYSTSMSMKDVEARLPAELFIRCHKSYIINIRAITSMEPYGRWTYTVHLRNTDNTALATSEKCEEINRRLHE